MPKVLPYFRWYPADAESDAKYAAMTLAELGLYHRCLNHSWANNGIPSDPYELGRELRVAVREIRKLWPRVALCFEMGPCGRLINKRQEEEREYAINKSEKSSSAVRTRYGRDTSVPTNVPTSVDTDVSPRAYESESVSESTFEKGTPKKKHKDTFPSDDWFFGEFWPLWPVKENKESARAAVAKISTEYRPLVIAGVKLQSARIAAMERPIHASTWLNQRRWEDAPRLFSAQQEPQRNDPAYRPYVDPYAHLENQ